MDHEFGEDALRVVSLNIEGANHFELLPDFLSKWKPHVLCLQEAPEYVVSRIAKLLGATQTYFVPTLYREGIGGQPLLEGLALFSTVPLVSAPRHFYYVEQKTKGLIPTYRLGDPDSYNRALAWVSVSHGGQEYLVANFHHTWTQNGDATPEQLVDTALLLDKLQNSADFPHLLLCGDSNAPRGLKAHDLFCERYTDHIPPQVKSTLDPVLHRTAAQKLERMVDVLFATPHYDVFGVEVVSGVSDHCAIVAKVLRR